MDLYNGRIEIIREETLRPTDPTQDVDAPVRDALRDIQNLDADDLSTPTSRAEFEPTVTIDAAIDAVSETSVGVIHRIDEQDRIVVHATRGQPRLRQFVQWCENEHVENLNTLSGRDLHRFRVKRQNEDGLAKSSMRGQLATLRMFLRFAASIDAVEPTLEEKILLPTTTEDDAREEMLNAEQAEEVLGYLRQYHYADLK